MRVKYVLTSLSVGGVEHATNADEIWRIIPVEAIPRIDESVHFELLGVRRVLDVCYLPESLETSEDAKYEVRLASRADDHERYRELKQSHGWSAC
jgi:hypothetical protein